MNKRLNNLKLTQMEPCLKNNSNVAATSTVEEYESSQTASIRSYSASSDDDLNNDNTTDYQETTIKASPRHQENLIPVLSEVSSSPSLATIVRLLEESKNKKQL